MLDGGSDSNGTKVTGHLRVFFTELIRHWTDASFETDISLMIHIKRSDGLEAKKNYYVKGTQIGISNSKGYYMRAQNKATDKIMMKMVKDLIDLLDAYPV